MKMKINEIKISLTTSRIHLSFFPESRKKDEFFLNWFSLCYYNCLENTKFIYNLLKFEFNYRRGGDL